MNVEANAKERLLTTNPKEGNESDNLNERGSCPRILSGSVHVFRVLLQPWSGVALYPIDAKEAVSNDGENNDSDVGRSIRMPTVISINKLDIACNIASFGLATCLSFGFWNFKDIWPLIIQDICKILNINIEDKYSNNAYVEFMGWNSLFMMFVMTYLSTAKQIFTPILKVFFSIILFLVLGMSYVISFGSVCSFEELKRFVCTIYNDCLQKKLPKRSDLMCLGAAAVASAIGALPNLLQSYFTLDHQSNLYLAAMLSAVLSVVFIETNPTQDNFKQFRLGSFNFKVACNLLADAYQSDFYWMMLAQGLGAIAMTEQFRQDYFNDNSATDKIVFCVLYNILGVFSVVCKAFLVDYFGGEAYNSYGFRDCTLLTTAGRDKISKLIPNFIPNMIRSYPYHGSKYPRLNFLYYTVSRLSSLNMSLQFTGLQHFNLCKFGDIFGVGDFTWYHVLELFLIWKGTVPCFFSNMLSFNNMSDMVHKLLVEVIFTIKALIGCGYQKDTAAFDQDVEKGSDDELQSPCNYVGLTAENKFLSTIKETIFSKGELYKLESSASCSM